MKFFNCPAIFNHGKGARVEALLVLTLIVAGAWRIGGVSPVQAQAKTKVNPDDGLTYVLIPPGTFQMGCSPNDLVCQDSEKPAHSVTITKGFWIGQTQVTQAAYKKVTGANPSKFQGDLFPVNGVSWEAAKAYCGRVKMRLPTEAEYEYAARGGNPAALYGPLNQIAWSIVSGDPKRVTIHDVGQRQPNAYGLYDMLGNVWEWVADWYGPYAPADAVDPKGPPKGQFHVLRGGSWDDVEVVLRASFRNKVVPGVSDSYSGFRCAGN